MRTLLLPFVILTSLSACGGGDDEAENGMQVYRTMGSLQCSGGGVSLATLQTQLTAAKVEVRAAACGTDGQALPTLCGTPDGKIGIFEIPPAQAAAAAAAGFMPLSTLPAAKTIPCT